MIQSIYTSVSNADIVPCGKKGRPIKSEPIPLLRDNYLGEYRTELERAKVRKNLGIADKASLLWGNIEGTIEELRDLITYIELKWKYSYTGITEEITTVKEALDYALYFISRYESNDLAVIELTEKVTQLLSLITLIEESLSEDIKTNSDNITVLLGNINDINLLLESINDSITNIDVDLNILNWITENLINSKSILLLDGVLEVLISKEDNNAIQKLEDGLHSKDYTLDITSIQDKLSNLEKFEASYTTELSDDTNAVYQVGGIDLNTTVGDLRGRSFSDIIDTILFPTYVRDLIQPLLEYEISSELVEVGNPIVLPTLTFTKNDSGEEYERVESITYNDSIVDSNTYDFIGTYKYNGIVKYRAGEYLINNKGETTDKRIEEGLLEVNVDISATYPWYSGNEEGLIKQPLVPFNLPSETIDFSLSGKAVIKLPGSNTLLTSFMVDGGLGYLNVDMNDWDVSTENIEGFTYKVWTKKDSYSAILPHRIDFILSE